MTVQYILTHSMYVTDFGLPHIHVSTNMQTVTDK